MERWIPTFDSLRLSFLPALALLVTLEVVSLLWVRGFGAFRVVSVRLLGEKIGFFCMLDRVSM